MKKILSVLLAVSLLALVACGADAPQGAGAGPDAGQEVRIGLVYPMSGPMAEMGRQFTDSLEFAAYFINEAQTDPIFADIPFAATEGIPNLGGARLSLIMVDDQNSPEIGMSETERLITQEGVVAIIGTQSSAVTRTVSSAAERLETPMIATNATALDLTDRGFEWFFRTTPHDGTFVTDTFRYIEVLNAEYGADIRTLGIVSEDTDFGALLLRGFTAEAAERGFEIVESITYPANAPNLAAEVIRLNRANPDTVLMASYSSDAILFIRTFAEQGFLPTAIIGQRAGFTAPEFLDSIGPQLAVGIATTSVWAEDLGDENPIVARLTEMYREWTVQQGTPFHLEFPRAFAAAITLADALNRAGSTDNVALQQALRETHIVNIGQLAVPWEGVQFDETGQNILASGIVMQVIDGDYRTVWPHERRAREPIIPLPAWDAR